MSPSLALINVLVQRHFFVFFHQSLLILEKVLFINGLSRGQVRLTHSLLVNVVAHSLLRAPVQLVKVVFLEIHVEVIEVFLRNSRIEVLVHFQDFISKLPRILPPLFVHLQQHSDGVFQNFVLFVSLEKLVEVEL